MLTVKYNPATLRYDLFAKNGEQTKGHSIITTLTCGTKFNLYSDDEDMLVQGRIEYHNVNGYYFICDEQGYVTYLHNGMLGTL